MMVSSCGCMNNPPGVCIKSLKYSAQSVKYDPPGNTSSSGRTTRKPSHARQKNIENFVRVPGMGESII
jgi:hypothetical protein